MRDRTSPAALPRAPDTGERAGLRVVGDGVRCPHCGRKLAESVEGRAVFRCRSTRCGGREVVIVTK